MTRILNGMDLLRAVPGFSRDLAQALGITRGAVAKWKRVPAERVLKVEAYSGISRHLLRPDIYPRPDAAGEQRLAGLPPGRKHKKPSNASNAAA